MAGPRKVFRIEETVAGRHGPQTDDPRAPLDADLTKELAALRALLSAPSHRQFAAIDESQQDEIQRLISELRLVQSAIRGALQERPGDDDAPFSVSRIAEELKAVIAASEQAAQKILAAAEDIDQAANNLSAALKSDLEQGLAQDIRDRVIQIFEACNYQDLSGQRVAKVLTMLGQIERQIARALADLAQVDTPAVHGPRLPYDRDHVSQRDIDSLFKVEIKSA